MCGPHGHVNGWMKHCTVLIVIFIFHAIVFDSVDNRFQHRGMNKRHIDVLTFFFICFSNKSCWYIGVVVMYYKWQVMVRNIFLSQDNLKLKEDKILRFHFNIMALIISKIQQCMFNYIQLNDHFLIITWLRTYFIAIYSVVYWYFQSTITVCA